MLQPTAGSLTLRLNGLSTGEMTLPMETQVPLRRWVEVRRKGEPVGIFRVVSLSLSSGQGQTLQLEHGAVLLEDSVTPKDCELSGSWRQVVSALLSYQQNPLQWQLGTVEVPDSETVILPCGEKNLLEALLGLLGQDNRYYIVWEQGARWLLHIRCKPEKPACEVRLSRNLSHCRLTWEDSALCTKVVHPLLPNGYLQDDEAVTAYGVVCQVLPLEEEATPEAVLATARRYLAEHSKPKLSIRCDSACLEEDTGEGLDDFSLGKRCRVALPTLGITAEEMVVSLHYPDALHQPKRVTLTLCNPGSTLPCLLSTLTKGVRGHRGGRGGSKRKADTDKIIRIINGDTTAYRITGAKLDVEGTVAFQNLQAEAASMNRILTGQATATLLKTALLNASNLTVQGHSAQWLTKTVDGKTLHYLGYA